MKMKQLVCAVLLFSFITIPTLATKPISQPVSDDPQTPIMVWGNAQEISTTRIYLKNSNHQDVNQDIVLNLSEDTIILEPVHGERRSLADIQENETLYAYVGPAMTRSLPPQAVPSVIFCDIPADFPIPSWTETETLLVQAKLKNRLAQQDRLYPSYVSGTATKIQDDQFILKNNHNQDTFETIVLHVSPKTIILDAVSGQPMEYNAISDGETLAVWISPAVTLSLPPQSSAVLILCNIPSDFTVPTYSEVQKVDQKDGGGLSVLTSNDMMLHIDDKTPLFPYLTKNIVTPHDIYPGVRILAWYSTVQESYPAQATPTKVMILPSEYSGWIALRDLDDIFVNGETLSASPFTENENLMLPLRAIAEALGCEVQWDADLPNQATVLYNGQPLYTLTLGSSTIAVGNDISSLTHSSVVKNGVTFLEANDLIQLHNLKLEGNWSPFR